MVAGRYPSSERAPSSAAATGPRGSLSPHFRLRDDIWIGVSLTRPEVPRRELPEHCPACGRAQTLDEARSLE